MEDIIVNRIKELQETIQDPIYQNGIVGGALLIAKLYSLIEEYNKTDYESGFLEGVKKLDID